MGFVTCMTIYITPKLPTLFWLCLQAFMFKFPNIVWRLFNGGSGVNLDKVVEMAEKTQLGSPDDREKTINHIAIYLDRWLETHREYHWNMLVRAKQKMARFCCFFCNKRAGTYLTAFYLTTKVRLVTTAVIMIIIIIDLSSTLTTIRTTRFTIAMYK